MFSQEKITGTQKRVWFGLFFLYTSTLSFHILYLLLFIQKNKSQRDFAATMTIV